MTMNMWAVLAATAAMFAVGAFWYMVPFGKIWGEIHGFDKLSKKEQREAQAKMGPFYLVQLVVTIVSAWVLARLMTLLPGYSPFTLAGLVWLGFVVPAQVSAVIFGGTEGKYIVQKSSIMAGEAVVRLMAAAWVLKTLL